MSKTDDQQPEPLISRDGDDVTYHRDGEQPEREEPTFGGMTLNKIRAADRNRTKAAYIAWQVVAFDLARALEREREERQKYQTMVEAPDFDVEALAREGTQRRKLDEAARKVSWIREQLHQRAEDAEEKVRRLEEQRDIDIAKARDEGVTGVIQLMVNVLERVNLRLVYNSKYPKVTLETFDGCPLEDWKKNLAESAKDETISQQAAEIERLRRSPARGW